MGETVWQKAKKNKNRVPKEKRPYYPTIQKNYAKKRKLPSLFV